MSRTRVTAKITRDQEEWEVECDSRTEAEVAAVIEAIRVGKKKSLIEKVKEAIATEPIKLIFTIIAGFVVAFLVWYLGLAP